MTNIVIFAQDGIDIAPRKFVEFDRNSSLINWFQMQTKRNINTLMLLYNRFVE